MAACKLVEDTKSKVAGTTLYTQGSCIRPTAVYFPPTATATDLTMVLWLHGYYVNNHRDIFELEDTKPTYLRESVQDAKKDVVLVAPFLGHRYVVQVPDPDHPGKTKPQSTGDSLDLTVLGPLEAKKGKDTGLEAYLKEVLALLKDAKGKPFTLKNLIIASHSAGGAMMRQATGAAGNLGAPARVLGVRLHVRPGSGLRGLGGRPAGRVPLLLPRGRSSESTTSSSSGSSCTGRQVARSRSRRWRFTCSWPRRSWAWST